MILKSHLYFNESEFKNYMIIYGTEVSDILVNFDWEKEADSLNLGSNSSILELSKEIRNQLTLRNIEVSLDEVVKELCQLIRKPFNESDLLGM